jgi:hypothetical protein
MKSLILAVAVALLTAPLALQAQSRRAADVRERIQQLEDRAALKALMDTFSVLADTKEVRKEVLLFTEVATGESHSGGQTTSFKGRDREEMAQS